MTHPQIKSVAEPWLLLPLVYNRKMEGTLTSYSHELSCLAQKDFVSALPGGEDSYNHLLSKFILELYAKQCSNDEMYFLDKTPRYYHIIPEIAKMFPDAKFIFLFRNPVHVFSSILRTWCEDRLKYLHFYELDIYEGPKALSRGSELLKEKAYLINYEALVDRPDFFVREICDYLDIDYSEALLQNFSGQVMTGRMGDPTGFKEYQTVSSASLDKWKLSFRTHFRQALLRKYVEKLGAKTLELQRYSQKDILEEVDTIEISDSLSIQDRVDLLRSNATKKLKVNLFFKQNFEWCRNVSLS